MSTQNHPIQASLKGLGSFGARFSEGERKVKELTQLTLVPTTCPDAIREDVVAITVF